MLPREIDFGDYDAVLIHNGAVIAKSHKTDLHMERDMIDVTSMDSHYHTTHYKEYIPGKLSFDMVMHNVLEDTKIETLRKVLQSADILTIYMKAKDGTKYYADCYMEALEVGSGGTLYPEATEELYCNIRLRGSGALTMEYDEV